MRPALWDHARTMMSRRTAIALVCLLAQTIAQSRGADVPKEYQLKAVLLFRLTQFVEWPVSAFEGKESPVVIGILGENPFGPAVEIATQGETAHGRPIKVRYVRDASEGAECHVLYVSRSESERIGEVLRMTGQKHVLTVSDVEGFARTVGGIVGFVMQENKVAIRINLDQAQNAGLAIDARLLRVAQVFKK